MEQQRWLVNVTAHTEGSMLQTMCQTVRILRVLVAEPLSENTSLLLMGKNGQEKQDHYSQNIAALAHSQRGICFVWELWFPFPSRHPMIFLKNNRRNNSSRKLIFTSPNGAWQVWAEVRRIEGGETAHTTDLLWGGLCGDCGDAPWVDGKVY